MTFGAAVLISLVRALLVAALVASVSGRVSRRLAATGSRTERGLGIAALAAILATPGFAVGYAWAPALLGVGALAQNAGVVLLTAASLLPVGVGLAWLLPPPPLAPSARHCLGLAQRTGAHLGFRARLGFALRGPLQPVLVCGGIVFLMAFHDFDLAAVLGVPSWTVWLFDAQVGGLPLGTTLRRALLPATIAITVLGLVLGLAHRGAPRPGSPRPGAPGLAPSGWAWLILAFPLVLTVIAPAASILREAIAAGPVVLDFAFAGEVGSSLLFASFGTALAGCVATGLIGGPVRRSWLVVVSTPGLCGGLVVALVVQALFQLSFPSAWYDSPLPLSLALAVTLLPLGIALRLIWDQVGRARGVHVAALAGSRAVTWVLRDRVRALGLGLLFVMASFELVAAAMLAPSGWTPASVRLYNLMHYGHSAALSAMVVASVSAVMAVVAVGLGAARWQLGRDLRR